MTQDSDDNESRVGSPAGNKARALQPTALDRIRAARPLKPLRGATVADPSTPRPRLVFGFDATASRAAAWASARRITDRMFDAIPGALDVALAVHGGDRLHTFTDFSADVGTFRRRASEVQCEGGQTRLCEIMAKSLDAGGVRVMSYIGDAFEESADDALQLADRFRLRGIRAVLLADHADDDALEVFGAIAHRTGGALLDFRANELELMGEVLQGLATLAIGGPRLLLTRKASGAKLLLEHLQR